MKTKEREVSKEEICQRKVQQEERGNCSKSRWQQAGEAAKTAYCRGDTRTLKREER